MNGLTTHLRALVLGSAAALWAVAPAFGGTATLEALFAELADPDNPDWSRAESDILRAWSKSGSPSMDLLLKRGQEALEAGDLPAAVEHLTALTDHAPEFAEGFATRASAYFLEGQLGPAVADLAHTLQIEPRHFAALAGLGVILEQLGRDEAALGAYRASLALHPHQDEVIQAIERLEKKTGGTAL
ncbi:MAG: hypothetical protein KDE00_07025 [Rhodobacteraceae bacterium]|nr:hypothetical protein [Paracoccaceae bacterium]